MKLDTLLRVTLQCKSTKVADDDDDDVRGNDEY